MPTPLAGTITIHPNNEQVAAPPIEYTEAEKIYINFRRQRMINARDMRDMARPEWDDMPFLTYFDILKKADDQYVAPRKNAQDTSINLGTIRDKDTSLVEYAMAHDFEPIAQAFDEDEDMFEELAETGEDLVRKSLKIEDWRDKSKLIYRSMVSFGTALVEDAYVQRWVMDKTMKQGFKAGMGSDKAEWETKMKMQYDGCQAKLWDLRKCYFGDIRKFFMNGPQGQPYFFTVEYESYDVVKQYFGGWDRFKHVSTFANPTPELSTTAFSFNWSLRPVSMNFVEIIRYYDPVANEFQLSLNGTDMLPLMKTTTKDAAGAEKILISGFPLTEISPSGLINFAKYDLEPMHDFAYSKGLPAKMRVTADVENMLMKLFIIMFKQKAKPTMGNKSGRLFGPEVTDPATVINDIRDGDLFPVLPSFTGAVPADFTFYENVKKELDKNSVERSWQGMDATQSDETATKNLNDQKAQVTLKVAAMFDGIISGNKQLYWLRTYNIMKNWTKPIDSRIDAAQKQLKQIYRTITIEADGRGGEKVAKKIVFTKDTPKLAEGKKRASLDDSFNVYQDELDHQDEYGTDLRITYLHPELFAALKAKWFYDCVPVPTSTDPLSYMVFAKQITDAMTFFGPQSMNVKKLKHRFSALTGNDFDTWFLNEKEMAMQQAMNPQPDPNDPNATQKPGVPGKPTGAGPSIATAMSGAKPAEMIGALSR
jgi:hypothetical protein